MIERMRSGPALRTRPRRHASTNAQPGFSSCRTSADRVRRPGRRLDVGRIRRATVLLGAVRREDIAFLGPGSGLPVPVEDRSPQHGAKRERVDGSRVARLPDQPPRVSLARLCGGQFRGRLRHGYGPCPDGVGEALPSRPKRELFRLPRRNDGQSHASHRGRDAVIARVCGTRTTLAGQERRRAAGRRCSDPRGGRAATHAGGKPAGRQPARGHLRREPCGA